MYGKLGRSPAPSWVGPTHRLCGTLALLVTLPVAYHCLWSLGFQTDSTRRYVHSVMGCVFYGAFATKVLCVRSARLPGWALPAVGRCALRLPRRAVADELALVLRQRRLPELLSVAVLDRVVHIVQIVTAVVVAAFVILLFVNEPAQPAPVPAAGSPGRGRHALLDEVRVLPRRGRRRQLRTRARRRRGRRPLPGSPRTRSRWSPEGRGSMPGFADTLTRRADRRRRRVHPHRSRLTAGSPLAGSDAEKPALRIASPVREIG